MASRSLPQFPYNSGSLPRACFQLQASSFPCFLPIHYLDTPFFFSSETHCAHSQPATLSAFCKYSYHVHSLKHKISWRCCCRKIDCTLDRPPRTQPIDIKLLLCQSESTQKSSRHSTYLPSESFGIQSEKKLDTRAHTTLPRLRLGRQRINPRLVSSVY